MNNNYFFIDGSSLLADIARFNKENRTNKKLSISEFIKYFMCKDEYRTINKDLLGLHGGSYKRFIFYFAKGEPRIDNLIIKHDIDSTEGWDISFKYCGERLQKTQEIKDWMTEYSPPQYISDRLNKSEKGVDITIATDMMFLAGQGKVDRAFLYTNDSDFIPLCERIKDLGCNISLFRLYKDKTNMGLKDHVDTFTYIQDTLINKVLIDV